MIDIKVRIKEGRMPTDVNKGRLISPKDPQGLLTAYQPCVLKKQKTILVRYEGTYLECNKDDFIVIKR